MCVVLLIQHSKCTCRVVICGLSGSAMLLHIISQTAWYLEKCYWIKMCVLTFFTTFVWNISHSKKNLARNSINVRRSSRQVTIVIVRIQWNLNFFFTCFEKILKYKISWKSIQWELSCFMWMDGHTDIMKVIVAFCSFINMPKNEWKPLGMIIFHHNFYIRLSEMWKREKVPSYWKKEVQFLNPTPHKMKC